MISLRNFGLLVVLTIVVAVAAATPTTNYYEPASHRVRRNPGGGGGGGGGGSVSKSCVDVCVPFNIKMEWSHKGQIAGKHCVQMNEPADKQGWDDNYLCFDKDYGVKWSYSWEMKDMKCTQITEADPDAWDNNYLCVPLTSKFKFTWSSSGPVPNSCCTKINEPDDPHGWDDNYLCLAAM